VAGRFLDELVSASQGRDTEQVVKERIQSMRKTKTAIPGFGHPQHSAGDPRANVLLALAKERGLNGPYLSMLRTVESALPEALGRPLPINVNGAIPAILLEIGFPVTALKSVAILARTAGILAHLREEGERPIGFVMAHAAAEAIDYDGKTSG
jgi:citrate synthase